MMKHLKQLLLSSPFLLLLLFTFNPVKVLGQALPIPPDCVVFVNITTTAGSGATVTVPNSPWFDNRTEQCQSWTFGYQATAVSGTFTSISVQAANATVTPLTGAFADWAGTVNTGVNPGTNQTGAVSALSTGCVNMVACTVPNSYLRVLLTRNNFVGTINGVLYGYKSGPIFNVSATVTNAGCPGTVATPCKVDGVTAAGSPPTTPPVLMAGQDGAPGNIRTIKTDSGGQPIVNQGTAAAVTAPWPIYNGQPAASTATWTSATAMNTTLTVATSGYGNMAFQYQKTGSITGGVIIFEGSVDGVNYQTLTVVAIGATTNSATSYALTSSNNIWQMYVGGMVSVQIRLSVVITGTGSAAFTMIPSATGPEFSSIVTQGAGNQLHTNVDSLPVGTGAATAQADGATNSPVVPTVTGPAAETVPGYPYKFNGATWDRDFVCTSSAPITFTAASGSLQIVGLSGSTIIRVCHLSIAASAATNITIQYGTGSNCAAGTTSLSGAYNNVTALALDFNGTLRTIAAQELCINSSATITAGGIVTYAQF